MGNKKSSSSTRKAHLASMGAYLLNMSHPSRFILDDLPDKLIEKREGGRPGWSKEDKSKILKKLLADAQPWRVGIKYGLMLRPEMGSSEAYLNRIVSDFIWKREHKEEKIKLSKMKTGGLDLNNIYKKHVGITWAYLNKKIPDFSYYDRWDVIQNIFMAFNYAYRMGQFRGEYGGASIGAFLKKVADRECEKAIAGRHSMGFLIGASREYKRRKKIIDESNLSREDKLKASLTLDEEFKNPANPRNWKEPAEYIMIEQKDRREPDKPLFPRSGVQVTWNSHFNDDDFISEPPLENEDFSKSSRFPLGGHYGQNPEARLDGYQAMRQLLLPLKERKHLFRALSGPGYALHIFPPETWAGMKIGDYLKIYNQFGFNRNGVKKTLETARKVFIQIAGKQSRGFTQYIKPPRIQWQKPFVVCVKCKRTVKPHYSFRYNRLSYCSACMLEINEKRKEALPGWPEVSEENQWVFDYFLIPENLSGKKHLKLVDAKTIRKSYFAWDTYIKTFGAKPGEKDTIIM